MIYKKECPYCHKVVEEEITPFDQTRDWYGYSFFCDCIDEEIESMDEHEAYKDYLAAREEANLINFDVWDKANGRTLDEFEKDLDQWCFEHEDMSCHRECPFGIEGREVVKEGVYGNCFDLVEWLRKKVEDGE